MDDKTEKHYDELQIQPRVYITANKLDFNEGNVIKYVSRWKYKNGIKDLLKAKNYIDYMIKAETHKICLNN